jgi:hypothetical protein
MTQIAFVTLFLGLTLGVRPVEIRITGPVHHVEIRLDDKVQTVMSAPPWRTSIDLSDHLLPHRLAAVAMDAAGRELARAEQTINLPRRPAEAQIVLERDLTGKPAKVHLLWQSIDADKPISASLTIDGEPVKLDSNLTAVIASVDSIHPHLLRGRVEGSNGFVAETEIAFGGGLEAQAQRKLFGIPIRTLSKDAVLTPSTAGQWLSTRDGAAAAVAVEELAGEVIIVREPLNVEAVERLEHGRAGGAMPAPLAESSAAAVRHSQPQARFVWPAASAAATALPTYIMPLTRPFDFSNADEFKAVLARVAAPRSAKHLSYTDAVAAAGLRAATTQRPRAVVLVLGERPRDDSELSPQQVREYLRAVGVPLFVWSLVPRGAAPGWNDVVDVSSPKAFRHAFDTLNDSLRSQRIVWIDGDYLPTEIAVSPAGRGLIETLAHH